MFTVSIQTDRNKLSFTYEKPVSASKVLEDAGLFLAHPCGGRGICKKCSILINNAEALACKTILTADAEIQYHEVKEKIQASPLKETQTTQKHPLLDSGHAAAIDIGTTTIAVYIYRFPEGKLVHSCCVANPQRHFGADVISRIQAYQNGNAMQLSNCVEEILRNATKDFSIDLSVICGNTAMLHLLTGQDPSGMAIAPYKADNLFGQWDNQKRYLVNCISAYVGADITAAILASSMNQHQTALLVDIGTNGEMVLKHKDKFFCCSTAAGPCFEGAGISCGIPAVPGAIDHVFWKNGKIEYTTIDRAPAAGICGSGLVDAIAVLLQAGIIDETGYMENDFYFRDSNVFLSCEDIRKFQLAKSAIRSGIDTLLHQENIQSEEIEIFEIAGGFGSYLNIESSAITGMIPKSLTSKASPIGNAAGAGCAMILRDSELLEDCKRIASYAKTISLADSTYFSERYVENMMFEV